MNSGRTAANSSTVSQGIQGQMIVICPDPFCDAYLSLHSLKFAHWNSASSPTCHLDLTGTHCFRYAKLQTALSTGLRVIVLTAKSLIFNYLRGVYSAIPSGTMKKVPRVQRTRIRLLDRLYAEYL